jgi:hypothetical protein
VWPASLAHAVHNAAWDVLGAFTGTSYPTIVNKYLVGDYGLLILVGAVIGPCGSTAGSCGAVRTSHARASRAAKPRRSSAKSATLHRQEPGMSPQKDKQEKPQRERMLPKRT